MILGIMRSLSLVSILFLLRFLPSAEAGWMLLPDSRYQQYLTYGLFIDQQSTLILRSGGRAWGALAGSLGLLEFSGWDSRPQLVAQASANTSFRWNERRDTLLTETVDARVGLSVLWTLDPDTRIVTGWSHQSGHISDNVEDPGLIGPNLGNEILYVRWVLDLPESVGFWRVGGTLKPFIGSEPGMKAFASDQFLEWSPWGITETSQKPTFYFAVGLEELGVDQIRLNSHFQMGLWTGNHGKRMEGRSTARLALGFYHGMDPRMKYAQFQLSRVRFAYFGLMFEL